MSTVRRRVDLDGETLAWLGLVLTTEFLLVALYLLVVDPVVTDWPLFVVPWIWLNIGGWAILTTSPAAASSRDRRIAAVIAGGYFLLLAYVGGIVGFDGAPITTTTSLKLVGIPPGWSPAFVYSSASFQLVLLPYKVVGYVALAYLVYATALDAASALAGGVLGIFSCVSCSFPIIAGVVTGVVGGGSALAAATSQWTYLLSTLVFAVTVGLLSWRPTVESLRTRFGE